MDKTKRSLKSIYQTKLSLKNSEVVKIMLKLKKLNIIDYLQHW